VFLLFFLCFRSGTSEWRLRTRVLCCSGADAKSERGPVSSAGQTAHLLAASQAHACRSEGTRLLIASSDGDAGCGPLFWHIRSRRILDQSPRVMHNWISGPSNFTGKLACTPTKENIMAVFVSKR